MEEIKKEFEELFRYLEQDKRKVYSAYGIEDLWHWIEQKLIEAKIEENKRWIESTWGTIHRQKLIDRNKQLEGGNNG